jgi:hypothetical protein
VKIETEYMFTLIAANAIAEAEGQPVPFEDFVEGLQLIRDRFSARYQEAREELRSR